MRPSAAMHPVLELVVALRPERVGVFGEHAVAVAWTIASSQKSVPIHSIAVAEDRLRLRADEGEAGDGVLTASHTIASTSLEQREVTPAQAAFPVEQRTDTTDDREAGDRRS